MRHRLFHTLVISSSFLLDACATTHGDVRDDASLPPDAGPSPASDAGAAADAFAEPDAFAAPDAFVEPDAGVFVDPRACEPGWPTTKGIFHVIRDGITYGCRFSETSNPDMPDLEMCCVLGPAEETAP